MKNSSLIRRRSLLLTAFLLSLFIYTSSFAGGGWPQPKGSGYFKLGQYAIIADQYFTPAGDIVDITTTGFYATYLYGEYGLTDRLTATVYFPFFSRSTLNRVESNTGELVQEGDFVNSVGDTDIGLKYNIINSSVAVSVGLTLGIPFGNPSGGTSELLQTGDGEFNQMLSVDVSKSFSDGKVYVSAMTGFNNRTEGFSDEFRYSVETGVNFSKKWWGIMRLYGINPLDNGDGEFVANNGIFSNNIEFISLSPELVYEVKDNWGVSAGAGFAFNAKRVLAAPAYSLGVFLKI
ncbi:MAG: hypothetical protein AAGI07_03130 [Bacteroidota bacterium]